MEGLHLGDCLEVMNQIETDSIDMVMCDPPYGTTACKWDSVIDIKKMWEHLLRICKTNAAMVFTSAQPFTSVLVCSNLKMFKYSWVFGKSLPVGVGYAKHRPMSNHEDVLVFSNGGGCTPYFPQKLNRTQIRKYTRRAASLSGSSSMTSHDGNERILSEREPNTILFFNTSNQKSKIHPTQKPIELMEYLIRTYTQENDLVLDFAMGSGTTGIACKQLNRRFIGIEKDPEIFKDAQLRLKNSVKGFC